MDLKVFVSRRNDICQIVLMIQTLQGSGRISGASSADMQAQWAGRAVSIQVGCAMRSCPIL